MKYVFAISGGVDSMLMWHMFKHLPHEVAHVNYNYRTDSKIDEELVIKTAKELNVKYHILNVDKYIGSGFESWARNVRYDFFKSIKHDVLFTAHNASDQAETILMNHRRGCGLYGLGGMRQYEHHKRPLIHLTKNEIYDLAKLYNIQWHEDYTNSDTMFTRNAIRAKLTNGRCKLLSLYADKCNKIWNEHYLNAIQLYDYPLNDNNKIVFKKPTETYYWNLLFHYNVKDLFSINKKHLILIHSNDKSTRIVNLPNNYSVIKKKSVIELIKN